MVDAHKAGEENVKLSQSFQVSRSGVRRVVKKLPERHKVQNKSGKEKKRSERCVQKSWNNHQDISRAQHRKDREETRTIWTKIIETEATWDQRRAWSWTEDHCETWWWKYHAAWLELGISSRLEEWWRKNNVWRLWRKTSSSQQQNQVAVVALSPNTTTSRNRSRKPGWTFLTGLVKALTHWIAESTREDHEIWRIPQERRKVWILAWILAEY